MRQGSGSCRPPWNPPPVRTSRPWFRHWRKSPQVRPRAAADLLRAWATERNGSAECAWRGSSRTPSPSPSSTRVNPPAPSACSTTRHHHTYENLLLAAHPPATVAASRWPLAARSARSPSSRVDGSARSGRRVRLLPKRVFIKVGKALCQIGSCAAASGSGPTSRFCAINLSGLLGVIAASQDAVARGRCRHPGWVEQLQAAREALETAIGNTDILLDMLKSVGL